MFTKVLEIVFLFSIGLATFSSFVERSCCTLALLLDTVSRYYQPSSVYSRRPMCIKCLLGQGLSGDRKMKSKVTNEQETRTKIKAVRGLSAINGKQKEGTVAPESQEGSVCTDP